MWTRSSLSIWCGWRSCGAFHTAVLVAEDRDLAEPVCTAQDAGRRVVVATVGGPASLAKELAQLTDEVIEIPHNILTKIVTLSLPPPHVS